MLERKLLVPANVLQLKIKLPNCDGVPATGPKWVELTEGWEKEFPAIAGGPLTVKVIKVGPYRKKDGARKWIIIQFDGSTTKEVAQEAVLVCS